MVSNISASVLYLQKLYDDLSMEHEEQELLTQKLSVLEPLVSYWFYEKDEEIQEIIQVLMNILSETNKAGVCKWNLKNRNWEQ